MKALGLLIAVLIVAGVAVAGILATEEPTTSTTTFTCGQAGNACSTASVPPSSGVPTIVVTSSTSVSTTTTTTTTSTTTASSTGTLTETSTSNETYGPGPFSTFPASWYDPCGSPVQGNRTTTNSVADSSFSVAGTINLTLVYSKIVNSTAFQAITAGSSWVTVDWSLTQESNSTGLYYSVQGEFILISGGHPVSYPQLDYFLATGEVVLDYNGPLISSCPP